MNEDGNGTGWTVRSGTWSVVKDGTWVYQGKNNLGDARATTGTTTWGNQTISARIKPVSFNGTNRYVALMGRVRDTSNYYFAALRSNNTIELRKLVGGTSTVLATKSLTVSPGTWYDVKLEFIGSALEPYVNGTQQLSATEGTFGNGMIGLGASYATANLEDIVVTQ
jgi:hypothetical protein